MVGMMANTSRMHLFRLRLATPTSAKPTTYQGEFGAARVQLAVNEGQGNTDSVFYALAER